MGTHVEPDVTAPPHYVLPESPLVFASFGYYESSSNLLTPYVLDKSHTDVVVSLQWSRSDSRLTPDTLNMWGDAYGGTFIHFTVLIWERAVVPVEPFTFKTLLDGPTVATLGVFSTFVDLAIGTASNEKSGKCESGKAH